MPVSAGELFRKSAMNLMNAALSMGCVAGELADVKKGDLIAVEYDDKTAFMGEFKRVVRTGTGLKIELTQYASICMASDDTGYIIRPGEFVSNTFPALLPGKPRGRYEFHVPRCFHSAQIHKGQDVDKLLQKYGCTMEQYEGIRSRRRA